LADGVILKTGDKSLAIKLEKHGYDWVKENL
ncbi:MAG: Fe-S cluster assembly ATPase SufC, partial [Zetaproteobacteria bacterium]|nr:Fe-S cluster assembly ATPase SufC [Zetaproteobacteria bacterium]